MFKVGDRVKHHTAGYVGNIVSIYVYDAYDIYPYTYIVKYDNTRIKTPVAHLNSELIPIIEPWEIWKKLNA